MSDGIPDELTLLERAQSGDGDAFEAIYQQHERRVYSICLGMTKNTADAEDMAQESFLKIYRKLRQFRGDSQLSTWIHRLPLMRY